jgi:hypothetical protein
MGTHSETPVSERAGRARRGRAATHDLVEAEADDVAAPRKEAAVPRYPQLVVVHLEVVPVPFPQRVVLTVVAAAHARVPIVLRGARAQSSHHERRRGIADEKARTGPRERERARKSRRRETGGAELGDARLGTSTVGPGVGGGGGGGARAPMEPPSSVGQRRAPPEATPSLPATRRSIRGNL